MKISPVERQTVVTAKTTSQAVNTKSAFKWWEAQNQRELCNQLLSTVAFLKETQSYRQRQVAIYARLYGNMSLFNFIGNSFSKMDQMHGLPSDRPTFNLVQAAGDTLISRISQSKPAPVFLTDDSDYKERNIAKRLNNFVQGEFYQCKAYEKGAIMLRDAIVTGDGIVKIFETQDKKVGLERRLSTEIFIDPNEAIYGEPRQLYEIKLMDRSVLMALMGSKYKTIISEAANAYPDNSADASKTVSDLVVVVEGWHLRSGKGFKDGRHTIACSAGVIFDEDYDKDRFPFVMMPYSQRLAGYWSQGLAEQLMGTQLEINSLLYGISKAIKLVGVPRVFVEQGSKVVGTSFNNEVGTIIKYSGTKPVYEIAPCVPQEIYAQLQRLIEYGFQQCGVSAMQATSQKPAGLNSGEAIRSYDDISTDRFAALSKRYDDTFVELAYGITDLAKDIAERDGKYQTIYPNKNGTKEIDLPECKLIQDPFVIQVFNQSSLPREPAGRMQKVTEMIQAGMITIKEGRRLLDYPDLDQVERLANASEERIYKILDQIVEDGEYTPPDPFLDLQLASDITVQYYNLYVPFKLEEERAQMLRDFHTQVQAMVQVATAPLQQVPGPTPQATPMPLPQSPLVPNAVQPGGQ